MSVRFLIVVVCLFLGKLKMFVGFCKFDWYLLSWLPISGYDAHPGSINLRFCKWDMWDEVELSMSDRGNVKSALYCTNWTYLMSFGNQSITFAIIVLNNSWKNCRSRWNQPCNGWNIIFTKLWNFCGWWFFFFVDGFFAQGGWFVQFWKFFLETP